MQNHYPIHAHPQSERGRHQPRNGRLACAHAVYGLRICVLHCRQLLLPETAIAAQEKNRIRLVKPVIQDHARQSTHPINSDLKRRKDNADDPPHSQQVLLGDALRVDRAQPQDEGKLPLPAHRPVQLLQRGLRLRQLHPRQVHHRLLQGVLRPQVGPLQQLEDLRVGLRAHPGHHQPNGSLPRQPAAGQASEQDRGTKEQAIGGPG